MSSIGSIGGNTAAWQKPQDYAHQAAHESASASRISPAREKAVPAAPSGISRVSGSEKAFHSAAEMPYIPNGYGPEDLAARTRAEYPELSRMVDPDDKWVQRLGSPFGDDTDENDLIPGDEPEDRFRTVGAPVDEKEEDTYRFPWEEDDEDDEEAGGVDGVKEKDDAPGVENGEKCQTCARRKYQDGSNDPGVSFKMPTKIDPSVAHARVRGHEMEHVVREGMKAKKEGRKVVSQTVTYHTAICPECGRVYTSGGTTRTVTGPDRAKEMREKLLEEMDDGFDISA